MTFERIDKNTGNIITYQYDYGVPVAFKAKKNKGFHQGEKIIFCFDSDHIGDKEATINSDDFYFEVALTKTEADSLFNAEVSQRSIAYSAKRYSAQNEFLETVLTGMLIVKGTVKYDG